MNKIENVQIRTTKLGLESHGIPTFYLDCVKPGSGQGFGGWDLRFYGIKPILRILEVVGVESWEELPGKHCRVKGDRNKLVAIGNIVENKWYNVEKEGK